MDQRMNTRSSAWAQTSILAAVLLVGCESEVAESPSDSRDLTLAQEWVVDGYAADLVTIHWIVATPNGNSFVGQSQAQRVLAYDADGQLRGTFGREGQGPGEFQNTVSAGLIGDTLWVVDGRQSRVTFIDTETLELVRTMPLPLGVEFSGRWLGFLGITPHGSIYAWLTGDSFDNVGHVITDIDGSAMRVIADFPPDPEVYRYQRSDGPGLLFRMPRPFSQRHFFSLNDDATRYAYVWASIEGPDAGTYRVDAWDARGDTVYSRTYPFALTEIPVAVADSAIEASAAFFGRNYNAGVAAAYSDMVPSPQVLPPVNDLVVGNDGSMWIQLRSLDPQENRYEVLDPVGDPVGVVTLDRDMQIAAATASHVWAIATDSLDVESVVKFAIVRE
jgi:hypothetical protein